jgi:hypothetical protein
VCRFRAQLCSFGTDCNRRICFFAHTQEQLRIPSEPVVADALASRAPYLQGRVAPESRYALYPDQVPQMVPVPGGRMLAASGQHQHMQQQQQQQLLGQADVSGMQMVYMPAGAPQAVALTQAHGQAAGLPGGQQWAPAGGAGGSSMLLVPAGQGAGGGSMGYYAVQPGGAAAGPVSQEYSAGMLVAPGMQLLGGSYGSGQPLQLVAAMPGDGGMQQYATVHPGGMQGAQVAYAPVFAAPGGGMTMQQWGGQEQQPAPPPPHALLPGMVVSVQQQQQQQRRLSQHHAHHQQHSQQQQLQLVVPEPAADAAASGHSARQQQEGSAYIITQSGQLAPTRGQLEGPYAVMAAGPSGMMQQQACSSMPGSSQGAVEQGGSAPCPPNVDDIAQQMAGWGIQ